MKLFDRIKAKLGGKAVRPCPLAKGTVAVVFTRTDTGAPLQNARVTLQGASPGNAATDNLGSAVFADRTPGDYTARVALPPGMVGFRMKEEERSGSVSAGANEILIFKAQPLGNLRVDIVDDQGNPVREASAIRANGPEVANQANAPSGSHTFNSIVAGAYTVSVTVPTDKYENRTVASATVNVPPGGTGVARVEAKRLLSVVTPKIEMEYKVVLLDRKLSSHQAATETRIVADDVTYIQVSASQTQGAVPAAYTGGATLQVTPANVEVYTDMRCTRLLAGGKLTNAQIFSGAPFILYLKGKTAGKFKAKLALDPSNDPAHITVAAPAEEEMGVVELEMKFHWFVKGDVEALQADPDVEPVANYHTALKNLALPEQKPLTDQQKVAEGRVLHVQDNKHNGRAKVVVQKLVAAQWPAGTDDYDIIIAEDNGSGAIALFDQEAEGKELPLAHKMKVRELKAKEATVWVEGKEACKKARDIVVGVGLDRAAGGLANEAKHNGDWGRCTAVRIEEVKLEYTAGGGEHAAWDEAQKRFYINLNKKVDPAGRKIKVSARLSEKLEGVPVRIMLAPDKDNGKAANWNIDFPAAGKNAGAAVKWKDVPAALKHLDKKDRKDLMHLGGITDRDGRVELELQLSRFGGDKYHPAAYLDQDAHLAKYVHGHADLGKREPVFAKVAPIQVWRKVFYQATRPPATPMPASAGFDASQQKVFIEPLMLEQKQMAAVNFTVDPFRPDWQFNPGGGDDAKLCVGTHNVDDAMNLFVAATTATSPKFHVILCDEQFDAKNVQTDARQVVFHGADGATKDVAMTSSTVSAGMLTICAPPLAGGALLITHSWNAKKKVGGAWNVTHSGTLDAANVEVRKDRASKDMVRVTRPAQCGGAAGGCPCGGAPTALPVDANNGIVITLQMRAADGGYNGWAPHGKPANVVKGGRADYAIHNTMAHELGHLFGGVRHASRAGLPDHPLYYQKRGGSGTHCAFNATWAPGAPALNPATPGELDAQGKGGGTWHNGSCIIFGYSVDMKREWCKHCALDLIHSDLSKF